MENCRQIRNDFEPNFMSDAREKQKGTVYRSTGSWYKVYLENGKLIDCRLRGKFRMKGFKSTNPVTVGDHVMIEGEGNEASIVEILPRKNYILRRSINLSKRMHILCANVDQAIILFTLNNPVTTLGYVDRLLVSCEAFGIEPILVFNKVDLLDSPELQKKLEDYEAIYNSVPIRSLRTCAMEENYRSQIQSLLKDKVSFVVGRSGAGKSTLINLADPELSLKTGEISEYSGRGKQTTTFAEMFPLAFGGHIIDSPGFKEMEMFDIEKHELSHFFPEMKPYLDDCKFNNCIHVREPGCAVKAAVEEDKIKASRYHTYLGMIEEIEQNWEKYGRSY